MKCLMVNTFEDEGGAARAAHRLHRGVIAEGVDSQLLVQCKTSNDPTIAGPQGRSVALLSTARALIDASPLLFYRSRFYPPWSLAWIPNNFDKQLVAFAPDIVHLHWTCFGFLPIQAIGRLRRPVVWTLHDSWPFTGGCHLPFDCIRYRESCGACPQLNSRSERDLSRWVWERKRKHWKELDLTIVAPSTWLTSSARSSRLFSRFRIETIPNGIDDNFYRPTDKTAARQRWGISLNQKVILAGAASFGRDRNKGIALLQEASHHLKSDGWGEQVEIVLFGAADGLEERDFGLKCRCVGRITDEIKLAELYAASDVFVLPSLQENLPNTLIEAMSCGVPAVAFDTGGVTDVIDHAVNGYCARFSHTGDLAKGIHWVLNDESRHVVLSRNAREKVTHDFSLKSVAGRYVALYESILAARQH